ncbi:MAG: serine/threonine-protein kinase, partial [Candidatus Obscuribacterales bacterium]|nr:serine/threonine-protein kinase [Candidatus Obscuribacterales bacterium]
IGGHYEILAKIGSGGMSTVYKARHVLLDKVVAIKCILPKLIHDKQTARRFQQEAKAATELNHENICLVKEFEIHEDNRAYLIMEFVDGRSLADLIASEGKLSVERVLSIMSQLCQGLTHAHSKGVIHRDIKPGNIVLIVDEEGRETVKIVDFGIAKLLREDQAGPDLTQTGEVFGTPNYMSPEQCLGRKVDLRSDIYSLGCLMYEMISGAPPFRAESSIEVILKHVNERPELKCSKDLAAIIEKCLEKSNDRRYSSGAELLEDIEAVQSQRPPVHVKPADARGRKIIGILLIIFSLTVFAVMGTSFFQNSTHRRELEKQWIAQNKTVVSLVRQNKLGEAEVVLESSLELAKQAKNRELVTLTLSKLADTEEKLGKIDEAHQHEQESLERPFFGNAQMFFLGISLLFIVIGLVIFLLFVFLFGHSQRNKNSIWTSSLKDLYKKCCLRP